MNPHINALLLASIFAMPSEANRSTLARQFAKQPKVKEWNQAKWERAEQKRQRRRERNLRNRSA
jgi:hypothetical protein